jgi:glucokinase
MEVLGVDLGGTKLALAVFSEGGEILSSESLPLGSRSGKEAGSFVTGLIRANLERARSEGLNIGSVGVSVPGISMVRTGTVWAPNIEGWIDYPLYREIKEAAGDIPVLIDSDRACSILGEVWMGNAKGCRDAVFLAVGTGIGAGILSNGEVLRGSDDIAGAIGWMALDRPFHSKYKNYGCFEYNASGDGMARVAREFLEKENDYSGMLRQLAPGTITSRHIFAAMDAGDKLADQVLGQCIVFWGMAVANIVSLLNPEKVILGGGVFGPAVRFIPEITKESELWAQPVSIRKVKIEASGLEGEAAVYGAGYLALKNPNALNH